MEARYAEIEEEIAPRREEQHHVAEAIFRITGSYPRGYRSSPPSTSRSRTSQSRSRSTMSEEERTAAILEYLGDQPEGMTGKAVADHIGVSTQTADKTIRALIEAGQIRSQGERRQRRLFANAA